MPEWNSIARHIQEAVGQVVDIGSVTSVGGGCISAAYQLRGGSQQYFVKVNAATTLPMFEAEAEGLAEMAQSQTIRVPEPLCWGTAGGDAYLVMEYLPLGGAGKGARLGEDLAALHRVTQGRFGWHRDNTIGATPQPNQYEDSWVRFWTEHRLGFQLQLAARKGAGSRLARAGEQLLECVPSFFDSYTPVASLLHGDLWSGNYAYSRDGQPVIFDPAVYYGDRETDLAMTELFGGFPADFYAAYEAAFPLDSGYAQRKTLYNLYHILNHFNLFGGGYLGQAEGMIDRLLSEAH
jgi:fructosamine-3-kinase